MRRKVASLLPRHLARLFMSQSLKSVSTTLHLLRYYLIHSPLTQTNLTPKSLFTMSSTTQTFPSSAMQTILQAASSEEGGQQLLLESMKTISTPLAVKLLDQINLGANSTEPFRLLEQGCGMGVVAPLLNEAVPREVLEKSSILCGDFSEPLVEFVKKRIEKEGWINTKAEVVDSQVCTVG